MRIINLSKNSVLATNALVAEHHAARIMGLLACQKFDFGQALVIPNCNAIHTRGMHFPIDVIFLEHHPIVRGQGVVLETVTMPPGNVWKLKEYRPELCSVIELPEGVIAATGSAPDDVLELMQ